jgi:hypothetical protein
LSRLQQRRDVEALRGIALVEQHQCDLPDVAMLQHAIERRAIALQLDVDLHAALQCRVWPHVRWRCAQRRVDRAAPRRGDAFLAEVVAVAGMLGAAAHEADLRAVIDHRDAARGEQPVVRVDEARVAGVHARHVVVVVERHQLVRVRVRPAGQVQRLGADRS